MPAGAGFGEARSRVIQAKEVCRAMC